MTSSEAAGGEAGASKPGQFNCRVLITPGNSVMLKVAMLIKLDQQLEKQLGKRCLQHMFHWPIEMGVRIF